MAPPNNKREGTRLARFEVWNWGTFHQQVWRIGPAGANALLTGDIGSGKSTLVDGLTTLLVPRPANQIVFNKAAGSEAQERSLASYVKGEYKNEKDEVTAAARAISLRNESSYSVVLAHFQQTGNANGVTLAQLLYFKEKGGKVERLFVVSPKELSIRDHFSGFDNVGQLRRRLRQQGLEVIDSLKEYAGHLRRHLGITNPRALDLFYQTVSMKSVDNLTQFVRQHMLEPGDSKKRVQTLCQSFDDLDKAHAAVVRARCQIDELRPLVDDGDQLQTLESSLTAWRQSRGLLEPWQAEQELSLERAREQKLLEEQRVCQSQLDKLSLDIRELKGREDSISRSLDDNGGRRLKEIAQQVARLESDMQVQRDYSRQYQMLGDRLALPAPKGEVQFTQNRDQLNRLRDEVDESLQALDEERVAQLGAQRGAKEIVATLSGEISELQNRPSNIGREPLMMRKRLCEELHIDEAELPFAGELIQVRDGERAWEGAVERVLHNFGLSLLVPNTHYQAVADFVDNTHLRGRLVYYRVLEPRRLQDLRDLPSQSLINKLDLKQDNLSYEWLTERLVKRFNYHCCDTLVDFHRLDRALTCSGQIKSGGDRHEKDDRHSLNDRKRFVLGWDNRQKLQALENERQAQQQTLLNIDGSIKRLDAGKKEIEQKQQALFGLELIGSFSQLDWKSSAQSIASLQQERTQIESSSDVLHALQEKLKQATKVREDKETKLNGKHTALAKAKATREQCQCNQERASDLIEIADQDALAQCRETLQSLYDEHFDAPPQLNNLVKRIAGLREHLQNRLDNGSSRRDTLRGRLINRMNNYCRQYLSDTQEVDASVESLPDFRRMLAELMEDGLPRYEAKFKQELNEKTIQSLVHFSTQLDRAESELKQKISRINHSLHGIDYNEGSYIQLQADTVNDGEIRQFRQDLRGCLGETLGEDLYDESRFLQVKSLIERFRGREGQVDADKRWTLKVTDVRNWSIFSAEERWREDNSRKDFFAGSSGKSGGQKEKLAYTVLASALAYQFGLDQQDTRRAYRFVVIDEAFGRGSESSTRYALELFQQLGLQLLVVTPLQKIHVIEPYIHHVHFVHNEENKYSQLRNMTIDEYREEKQAREQGQLQQALDKLTDT